LARPERRRRAWLAGQWHYLEHDWTATEGSYAFEPPGEVHTLVVDEGVDEMITWFHVTGGLIYVDPDGHPIGYEDVHTRLDATRRHYEAVGLGADYVDQYVR
jgi:2,4'-dihydroxyacetophenone dioxygenase